MMALRFEGHRPVIVALDGQPCDPHEPAEGRILLGPAMRPMSMLDMQGEPGRRTGWWTSFYDDLVVHLDRLAYGKAPPLRPHPLGCVAPPAAQSRAAAPTSPPP